VDSVEGKVLGKDTFSPSIVAMDIDPNADCLFIGTANMLINPPKRELLVTLSEVF
jgi:hypothetical protein